MLDTVQFQERLGELAQTLVDGRRQARLGSSPGAQEAAFSGALGKLQGGLDILFGIERAGQATRLEMGCNLIETGLAELQNLEKSDG